jgi:hypothetical protein
LNIDRLHPQVLTPLEVVLKDARDGYDLNGAERIKRMANG